ncbi:MAG: SRPBCC family protein [Acidobacteriota bacterium]
MTRVIHLSVSLACTPERAFAWFTQNELLERWLCRHAEVEPYTGGKFHLFWDPYDRENDCTFGCQVTAAAPGRLIAFEWKGPKQFRKTMNTCDPLTHVSVSFHEVRGEAGPETAVHLVHSGWCCSPEWVEARVWTEMAWARALEKLKEQSGGS